jgi:hypothetical protein
LSGYVFTIDKSTAGINAPNFVLLQRVGGNVIPAAGKKSNHHFRAGDFIPHHPEKISFSPDLWFLPPVHPFMPSIDSGAANLKILFHKSLRLLADRQAASDFATIRAAQLPTNSGA